LRSGALVVVVLSIAVVRIFDLSTHGVAIVGHIETGLPSVGLPNGLALADYGRLAASAVGIMLVGFAGGLAAAEELRDT
jgi:MFS superfamily sulfate permease-like transporter